MTPPTTPDAHTFSWDGFSFNVPDAWNLSFYHFDHPVNALRMEDDTDVRLELEWTRPRRPVDRSRLERRFAKASETLHTAADDVEPFDDLPPGWGATSYRMPDKRRLLTAFFLPASPPFFAFFRLHFDPGSRRESDRSFRSLADSFRLHPPGPIPWSFYDFHVQLHSGFRLVSTSLEAGRKLALFQWRLRRLFLWQFSLADRIAPDRNFAPWAANFLNRFPLVHGPRFSPDGPDTIRVRRSRWHPLGHYEEIGRLCFRYAAALSHVPERNVLLLSLFQYRLPSDLALLANVRIQPTRNP